jgi:PhnB protein
VSPATLGGTATTLYVEVPDVDAVYVRVLAAGARIAHPPKDEAYGARSFTMLDPFGHRWMIQTPTGSPTIEEVQAQVEGYTITTPPE